MLAFGSVLAVVRNQVKRDLKRHGLPREKVLAAVVRLLETTAIRIGNDEYAKENGSFGITTLRNRHVKKSHYGVRFEFKGKSGVHHSIELCDRTVARIVRRCHELPGYRLFQYIDENGEVCDVDSDDVNQYLRQTIGEDFTAKDFRTWTGTVVAFRELAAAGPHRGKKDEKTKFGLALKQVSLHLGNRPATCRKYYVHPAIVAAYSDGSLFDIAQGKHRSPASASGSHRADERSVMVLIAKHMREVSASKSHHRGATRLAA